MKKIINDYQSKGLNNQRIFQNIGEKENYKNFCKLIQNEFKFKQREKEVLNQVPFDWKTFLSNIKTKYREQLRHSHLISVFLSQKFLENFSFENIYKFIWKLAFNKKEYRLSHSVSDSENIRDPQNEPHLKQIKKSKQKHKEIQIYLKRKNSKTIQESDNGLAKMIYEQNSNKRIELFKIVLESKDGELSDEVIYFYYIRMVLRKLFYGICNLFLRNINSLIEKKMFKITKKTTLEMVSFQLIISYKQDESDYDCDSDESCLSTYSDWSNPEPDRRQNTVQISDKVKKQTKIESLRVDGKNSGKRKKPRNESPTNEINKSQSSHSHQSANIQMETIQNPEEKSGIFSKESSVQKKESVQINKVDSTKQTQTTNSNQLNETKETIDNTFLNSFQVDFDIKTFFNYENNQPKQQINLNPFDIDENEEENWEREEVSGSPNQTREDFTSQLNCESRVNTTNLADNSNLIDNTNQSILSSSTKCGENLASIVNKSIYNENLRPKTKCESGRKSVSQLDLSVELAMIQTKFQKDDILDIKILQIKYNPHFWNIKKHVYNVNHRFSKETNPIQIMNELCKYKNHNFGIEFKDKTVTVQNKGTVRNIFNFNCKITFENNEGTQPTEFCGEIEAKSKKVAKKFIYYIFTQILLGFPFGELEINEQTLNLSSFQTDFGIQKNQKIQETFIENKSILSGLNTQKKPRNLDESFKWTKMRNDNAEKVLEKKLKKFEESYNRENRASKIECRVLDKSRFAEFLESIKNKNQSIKNLWAKLNPQKRHEIVKSIMEEELKMYILEYDFLNKVNFYFKNNNQTKTLFLEIKNNPYNIEQIHDFILIGLILEI